MDIPDLEERKRMAIRMVGKIADSSGFGEDLYHLALDLAYIEEWPDDYYPELRDSAQKPT